MAERYNLCKLEEEICALTTFHIQSKFNVYFSQEGFSSELLIHINDVTLPKMMSTVSIEEIARLLKNVEIGCLTITVCWRRIPGNIQKTRDITYF